LKVLTFDNLIQSFKDKVVVIIGSAPSALDNNSESIESHDEIIRVNNFKTTGTDLKGRYYDFRNKVGHRTDWHYSFYGGSIRTKVEELEGIKGHICKCPNEEIVHMTDWHKERHFEKACGWAWIYRKRNDYWVAPVYIPIKSHYLRLFNILGGHVPSTGFACIWEMLNLPVKRLYITGFDFFRSGVHNINEHWSTGKNPDDPIKHLPEKEFEFFKEWVKTDNRIYVDNHLRRMIDAG